MIILKALVTMVLCVAAFVAFMFGVWFTDETVIFDPELVENRHKHQGDYK